MRLEAFDYALPPELIASRPTKKREQSRLLIIDRTQQQWREQPFADIAGLFGPQDVLVFNQSKVIPARLRLSKSSELFLSEQVAENLWKCLVRPGKKFRAGANHAFADGTAAYVREVMADGLRLVEFTPTQGDFWAFLERQGEIPLPPYLGRDADQSDRERYQTIYAADPGSVAAPTAGLHFSDELFAALRERGVGLEFVTLHVGLGTFLPVKTAEVSEHRMHAEWYEIDAETAARISRAKREGKKITAVGSTSLRTLEAAAHDGLIESGSGKTDIFLYPPAAFQVVDHFLTNFHLPKSTLMMLVAAFADPDGTAGIELVRRVYTHAVRERFRFFSYGDASLWW